MLRLGVHLSISKGLSKVFDLARELGCNCPQIFSHSPRSWRFELPNEEEVERFKQRYRVEDIKPIFVHQS
ncbi:MAG TPA: endonuclease IV, partial [Thermoplasmatales archaeon]|nr:endonuclease IV [Thermoplasmatales archaeon]HEX16907.1 endonuclease IV [Thermoplasmatales archaeon]